MRIASYIVLFVLLVVVLFFAILNADFVTLDYHFGAVDVPLSLALVATMIVGALLGILASVGMLLRMRREVSKLRKTVKLTEKEVTNLRAIPIKEKH